MIDDAADDPSEAFFLPDQLTCGEEGDPRLIAAKLVADDADHYDLREGDAVILFLMRADPKYDQHKVELGRMCLPMWQGSMGPVARWLLAKVCGGLPDFIMILDATFWTQATHEQRVALVDHELTHAAVKTDREGMKLFTDDGRPRWSIRPHDIEEFNRIVAKYGAWTPDITAFLAAAGAGRKYP